MADYGVKVSEDGYDVKTATDQNLSLKSGLDLIKMSKQGSVNLSYGLNYVYHNLGYAPQYLVFYWYFDNASFLATYESNNFTAYVETFVDSEKLVILNPDPSYFESAYYYIFYQQTLRCMEKLANVILVEVKPILSFDEGLANRTRDEIDKNYP